MLNNLYRCATGEAWPSIMLSCEAGRPCDPRALVITYLIHWNSLKVIRGFNIKVKAHVRTSDKLVCLWQSPKKLCNSWDYWPDPVVHHLLPKSSMVDQYVKGHCLLRSKLRNLCLYYSHVIILLMMVSVDFRCPSMRPWASRWLRTRTRPAAPLSPTSTLSPSFSSAHFWSVPTYIHSFLHR